MDRRNSRQKAEALLLQQKHFHQKEAHNRQKKPQCSEGLQGADVSLQRDLAIAWPGTCGPRKEQRKPPRAPTDNRNTQETIRKKLTMDRRNSRQKAEAVLLQQKIVHQKEAHNRQKKPQNSEAYREPVSVSGQSSTLHFEISGP